MTKENTPCSLAAASASGREGGAVPVAVLLGPTASGKSALALQIAGEMGWEIISCDSRQIYRGMDIGTAKPSQKEQELVPHWLIDILDPSEEYSAYRFARDAAAIIRQRAALRKNLLVCGGTGLYFRALCEGLTEMEATDSKLREALMSRAAVEGTDALYRELSAVDPRAAQRIHSNDLQRIVRALAVFRQTGTSISSLGSAESRPPEDMRFIVATLTMSRSELYRRIDCRVDEMVAKGLWEEFERLRKSSYDRGSPGMQSVGYRELFDVEEGSTTFEAAVELIKRNSRRYAKRQVTWFAHQTAGEAFEAPAHWTAVRDYYLREGMGEEWQ
ncbi:MAG: tRNA (adenosine(37)-N6)-dimethylallyltransferase MiaA [Chitinispirillaceae bacterium]|nr:tRNA (adenosine(37)-N6)-dimethylallyltransferase MiaA [Chitinispirillaceae bacterium]